MSPHKMSVVGMVYALIGTVHFQANNDALRSRVHYTTTSDYMQLHCLVEFCSSTLSRC